MDSGNYPAAIYPVEIISRRWIGKPRIKKPPYLACVSRFKPQILYSSREIGLRIGSKEVKGGGEKIALEKIIGKTVIKIDV